MPAMQAESTMHNGQIPQNYSLGARRCSRAYAGAARPHPRGLQAAPTDSRAYVRNAQSLDGCDSLSDQDAPARQHRNKLACAGIQSKANDANIRRKTTDEGDDGVVSRLFAKIRTKSPRSGVKILRAVTVATKSAAEILRFYTASVGSRQPLPNPERRESALDLQLRQGSTRHPGRGRLRPESELRRKPPPILAILLCYTKFRRREWVRM